jgi:hypothetical protein
MSELVCSYKRPDPNLLRATNVPKKQKKKKKKRKHVCQVQAYSSALPVVPKDPRGVLVDLRYDRDSQ